MLFCEIDLSAAELWVLAYEARETKLIEVLTSGRDAHCATANFMFDCPEDVVAREDKLFGKVTDAHELAELRRSRLPEIYDLCSTPPTGNMTLRQAGKKSNYGLGYGMEANRFSLENGIPLGEAQLLVMLYREKAYPRVPAWYKELQAELKANRRRLVNVYGRPYEFRKPWGPELFNQAYSYKPQSTIGDLVSTAECTLYEELEEIGLAAFCLDNSLQVHDSLEFQVPEGDLDFSAWLIARAASLLSPTLTIHGQSFTIPIDGLLGRTLGKSSMRSIELFPGDEVSQRKELERCLGA